MLDDIKQNLWANDVLGFGSLAVSDECVANILGDAVSVIQKPITAQKLITANHAQAQILTLLHAPLSLRLISGQLRLPEAATEIAGAIA